MFRIALRYFTIGCWLLTALLLGVWVSSYFYSFSHKEIRGAKSKANCYAQEVEMSVGWGNCLIGIYQRYEFRFQMRYFYPEEDHSESSYEYNPYSSAAASSRPGLYRFSNTVEANYFGTKGELSLWSRRITIPLWMPTGISALCPITHLIMCIYQYRRYWLRMDRLCDGKCQECGYDLRGGSEKCPECGAETPDVFRRRFAPIHHQ